MAACCPAGPARGGWVFRVNFGRGFTESEPKTVQKWKKMVRKCEKTEQKVLFYSKNGGFSHKFFHKSWSLPPKIRQNV